eukprot:6501716-Prymnesium_polylepis.1
MGHTLAVKFADVQTPRAVAARDRTAREWAPRGWVGPHTLTVALRTHNATSAEFCAQVARPRGTLTGLCVPASAE